ncbi:hypothetical protein PanWU01x14_169480 [Parasponia andersonii]|uniref:Uncharacterized protein n=1 Tax=Parasponia andersonii TaxID=3476 RepID=A0A2P5CAF8_PARAD|nr:hypothetical protein PanWU01x14_169480 [Parasponia andersonii]
MNCRYALSSQAQTKLLSGFKMGDLKERKTWRRSLLWFKLMKPISVLWVFVEKKMGLCVE